MVDCDHLVRLGIEEIPRDLKMSTVNECSAINSGVCKLLLTSFDKRQMVSVDRAFSVGKLSVRTQRHSLVGAALAWPHLSNIPFRDIRDRRVKLLIGTDVPEAHWVEEQKKGTRKEPFAVGSLLGWMILGPSGGCNANSRNTHAIAFTSEELSQR